MHRFAILFFLILATPLRANLGETVEQCVQRYGRPVTFSEASSTNPFGTLVFTSGPYTLLVFLIGDKEVGARVSKQDKTAFTDAERQTIMGADSTTSPWAPHASTDPTCLQWNRTDDATVLYDKAAHVLIFTSSEMARALHAPRPASPPESAQVTPAIPDAPIPIAPPATNAPPAPASTNAPPPPRKPFLTAPVAPAPPTLWPSTNGAGPTN